VKSPWASETRKLGTRRRLLPQQPRISELLNILGKSTGLHLLKRALLLRPGPLNGTDFQRVGCVYGEHWIFIKPRISIVFCFTLWHAIVEHYDIFCSAEMRMLAEEEYAQSSLVLFAADKLIS
jgi:hypothetical protein